MNRPISYREVLEPAIAAEKADHELFCVCPDKASYQRAIRWVRQKHQESFGTYREWIDEAKRRLLAGEELKD